MLRRIHPITSPFGTPVRLMCSGARKAIIPRDVSMCIHIRARVFKYRVYARASDGASLNNPFTF